jgi:DNA-binding transcriptional LysR family regulator
MDLVDRIESRLKLRDLRVLMSVIAAGSMSKAAERLGTSQPAISRSIFELEQIVGVRLLDRSPRGIEPTLYGRALIIRATAVFDELKQGGQDINFLSDPTVGEIRIGAPPIVAIGLIPAVIDRLARNHSRLSFQVLGSDTETALQALEERKVDFVIAHTINPLSKEQFDTEVIYQEPHVVAVGARNRWVRRRKVKLADLVAEAWVLPPRDSPFGSVVSDAFHAEGLDVPRAVVTSSFPLRNTLLATGRYFTMIPRITSTFHPNNSALKCVRIELPSTVRPLAIVTLKNRTLSAAAHQFIAYTCELTKPFFTRGPRF